MDQQAEVVELDDGRDKVQAQTDPWRISDLVGAIEARLQSPAGRCPAPYHSRAPLSPCRRVKGQSRHCRLPA